jgi:hypothetical protein
LVKDCFTDTAVSSFQRLIVVAKLNSYLNAAFCLTAMAIRDMGGLNYDLNGRTWSETEILDYLAQNYIARVS